MIGWTTQVWQGKKWIGFFDSVDTAQSWINKQARPSSYSVTLSKTGGKDS